MLAVNLAIIYLYVVFTVYADGAGTNSLNVSLCYYKTSSKTKLSTFKNDPFFPFIF